MTFNNLKYFKPEEFTCKCGCGFNEMDEFTLRLLDIARELADVPFKISSGCRCPEHNKAVGGVENSSHTKGFAVDIEIDNDYTRFKIKKALLDAGFLRIGESKNFIHVDTDPDKTQERSWTY